MDAQVISRRYIFREDRPVLSNTVEHLNAAYYAQITDTTYRPSGLRSRPTVSAHARVFAAGIVGLFGFVALFVMIGALG